ncbi:caspase family protein (plasmid) [Rhizobium sp. 32-5/1]|uniref:caspase family protein n=1 Tax=Rhizobium sp. 32-5/1 TaxID=3019602 RepID=UPI00240D4901|nr:caspase family protein [Rhizobium sp. 32-5/1]WEZ85781.1 caspase family protein [Rhizobium sp. 32-5/1]
MKIFILIILIFLSNSTHTSASTNILSIRSPEKKIAVVIGNSAYKYVSPLKNTANDAHGVSNQLRNLGFEVILSVDDDQDLFFSKIARFVDSSKTADVVLFYYAGHGAQRNNRNYLLPIDYSVGAADPLDFNQLVQTLQTANPESAKIFIVDACRNLPEAFAAKFGFDEQRGLARVTLPDSAENSGSTGGYFNIIAFSTAAGNTAEDGKGENSPYTASLIKYLPQRGIEVAELFRMVAADVLVSTQSTQRPEFLVQTSRPLYFADPIVTECDKLAVEQENYMGLPGVPFEDVDPRTAVPACENAVRAEPTSSRLKNNLGRAYERAGRLEDAMRLYDESHRAGNVQATNALGVAYIAGCGLPSPLLEEGVELLISAKLRGSRDALASLTAHDLANHVTPQTLKQVMFVLQKASYVEQVGQWDDQAKNALERYQREHDLAVKGLTIETLHAMKLHGKLPKGFKCH